MKKVYNYYFPTPQYLSMPSFALDISDESIKYGELVLHGHGPMLGRYGQQPIPSGVVVSGKIEDPIKLVEILKELGKREHISFVRVALPEEQMYLFTLVLPILPAEQIRETILLQLEEHVPLAVADAVFDFDIVNQTADSLLIQVAVTSISIMESYLSVFEQSGLIPISFELEAQAIARAVIPEHETGATMIVDFGRTRTGISIAEGNRVLFTSTFDMGGKALTEMVAKNFNLSFEEAEKMKRTYGRDYQDGTKTDIFPVIINGISVLRDELNKHYVYWHTHPGEDGQPHKKIEKLVFCGGDANLAGLAQYFEASMKVKVEYANAWVNVFDMMVEVPNMPFDDSLSYVTVLGLALADFSESI